MGIDSGEPI